MGDLANKWYLDEGEADSLLEDNGGGNFTLTLDIADADLLLDGLRALLMGTSDKAQFFVNPQPDGSCRLFTVRIKPDTDEPEA